MSLTVGRRLVAALLVSLLAGCGLIGEDWPTPSQTPSPTTGEPPSADAP